MQQKCASDAVLDVRGLQCPQPLLRTKKALNDLKVGQVLWILCTDPSSVLDFKAFAAQTSHVLLDQQQIGAELHFWLRKS